MSNLHRHVQTTATTKMQSNQRLTPLSKDNLSNSIDQFPAFQCIDIIMSLTVWMATVNE
jgi:hypothetical protein